MLLHRPAVISSLGRLFTAHIGVVLFEASHPFWGWLKGARKRKDPILGAPLILEHTRYSVLTWNVARTQHEMLSHPMTRH